MLAIAGWALHRDGAIVHPTASRSFAAMTSANTGGASPIHLVKMGLATGGEGGMILLIGLLWGVVVAALCLSMFVRLAALAFKPEHTGVQTHDEAGMIRLPTLMNFDNQDR